MKKILFLFVVLALSIQYTFAQSGAEIKFETTSHNFGTFSESDAVVSYEFKFTNTGDAPLVIHQAVASCGCTVPDYTKEPILPGKQGVIKITYNGVGRSLGKFTKPITVRTNSNTNNGMLRLTIEGEMIAKNN